jgi:hypothetical protein
MLAAIAHTAAVILDLRANEGGRAGMVQFLASYFVDEQPHPLSGVYSRADNTTRASHTLATVLGQRMVNVPLFALVSGATFAAGEALAYDLQALKRALQFGKDTQQGLAVGEGLSTLAKIYSQRGAADKAEHYFQASIENHVTGGRLVQEAVVYYNLVLHRILHEDNVGAMQALDTARPKFTQYQMQWYSEKARRLYASLE